MIRHDVQFPVRATTIFTNNLTHENILVRKVSKHLYSVPRFLPAYTPRPHYT